MLRFHAFNMSKYLNKLVLTYYRMTNNKNRISSNKLKDQSISDQVVVFHLHTILINHYSCTV